MVNWLKAKKLSYEERKELEALRKVVRHVEKKQHFYSILINNLYSPDKRSKDQAKFELSLFFGDLIYEITYGRDDL